VIRRSLSFAASPGYRVVLILIGLAVALPAPSYAAGSWHAEAAVPDIGQRSWRYATPALTPAPHTPLAGSAITTVSWSWGFVGHRSDPALQTRLCGGGRCIDAAAGSGRSTAFSGLPVATPFRMIWWLPGSGRRDRRLRGERLRVIVNFQ
jgi:flagellar protein FlhE